MSDFTNNETLDGPQADLIYALAAAPGVLPGHSGLVVAARSSGLRISRDGGQTWQDALRSLNLTEPLPVTSLAVSPDFARHPALFAGAPGGIFLSQDGGQTWKISPLPPPPPTVSALAVSPVFVEDETIFAATMEDGVYISKDGGASWVTWNFGLLDLHLICLAVSPAFAEDETLFAGTETGLFRSTNGGRAWREVELPFGYDPILSLALSPHYQKDHTLYAGTESRGLWISTDEGTTWTPWAAGQIEEPINTLYALPAGLAALTGSGIWFSDRAGQHWQNLLPEAYAARELSAALLPPDFAPGSTILAGFADGTIQTIQV
jgi:photosystem II stability/assembly factor-like uncharacterized protein